MTQARESNNNVVYAVASGEYSQYGISVLFTRKEDAEAAAKGWGYVEEYLLFDRPAQEATRYDKTLWMSPDGSVRTDSRSYKAPEWQWNGRQPIEQEWTTTDREHPPLTRWLRGHPDNAPYPGAGDTPVVGVAGYDKEAVASRFKERQGEVVAYIAKLKETIPA